MNGPEKAPGRARRGPKYASLGGFWAQSTNSGTQSRSRLSFVPGVDVKVGVNITKHLDFNIGYTFFHWNHVAHPGQQLDYRVNGDYSYLLNTNNTGIPTFQGRPFPVKVFKDSDFWAQGLTAGFKVKF